MKKRILIILAAVLTLSVLGGCTFRPKTADGPAVSQSAEPGPTAAPELTYHTVTYRLQGEVIATEQVAEGTNPQQVPAMSGNSGIIGWKNANGAPTNAWSVFITADTVFDAELGPELKREGGYFAPETDGLFHPLNKFTRSDAARAVYAVMAHKPAGETFLKDVTTRAKCWDAATSLVTEGYMALDENGRFFPDLAITKDDFADLLGRIFSPGEVKKALADLPEPMDRSQAAAVFNALLMPGPRSEKPYYPDVAPDAAYYEAVETAGIAGEGPWTEGEKLPAGFVNLEGYLYCVRPDGYFLCDAMEGTLYFNPAGRYTSGDESVDKYAAEIIADQTNDSMTREEMLRAMYVYVRDHYLYLRRNYYGIAETGWELSEALLMFQTGKGNCYNFTAAFWALARGIGYDAVCYSGLVGKDRDPHSWVEIEMDGEKRIFDVETEMQYRLIDDYITSMYNIDYERGELWSYVRDPEG